MKTWHVRLHFPDSIVHSHQTFDTLENAYYWAGTAVYYYHVLTKKPFIYYGEVRNG